MQNNEKPLTCYCVQFFLVNTKNAIVTQIHVHVFLSLHCIIYNSYQIQLNATLIMCTVYCTCRRHSCIETLFVYLLHVCYCKIIIIVLYWVIIFLTSRTSKNIVNLNNLNLLKL